MARLPGGVWMAMAVTVAAACGSEHGATSTSSGASTGQGGSSASDSASNSSAASSGGQAGTAGAAGSAGEVGGGAGGIVPGDSGDPSSPTGPWSCRGTTGTTIPADGLYWMTTFGASDATTGTDCDDPGDNCIGACNHSAVAQGLCDAAEENVSAICERKVEWFVADADRYGCGARVLVEYPPSGKKLVAFVIDRGPACFVEQKDDFAVLDASPAVNEYLTGETQHAVGEAKVQVTEVMDGTPLGPVN